MAEARLFRQVYGLYLQSGGGLEEHILEPVHFLQRTLTGDGLNLRYGIAV